MKRTRQKTQEQLWDQLQRVHDRLQKRIDYRAADPAMVDVPGGSTGLVIRLERQLRDKGPEQTIFEDHLDLITLRRLRRILERARILDELIRAEAHFA